MNKPVSKHVKLALTLALAVLPGAANAAGVQREIHFAPGTYGASYGGTVRGYNYDSYVFYAHRGQHLKVGVGQQPLTPVLFHKSLRDAVNMEAYSPALNRSGDYILPFDGRYELRLLQTRNAARSGRQVPYTLSIRIW
ncbi:hypothetical protein [Deinococcus sp. Marseille-Q6407]|uniref:hypothetical protein n=1 Tax=Deinococcus sp. Marseille-Q6407 TaxID=2969223 RepID=UPI0021BF1DF1|nr:hypothetical protein [Deinococcus sp. Marseille-Q6407]